jgi:tetratricopeptide (TPR) repeat protein
MLKKESKFMRLKYRFLWKISLISVIFGIFYLLGLCCFANVNEEWNRKAEELFSQGIQAERQEKNTDAEKFYEQCLRLVKENNIVRLESPVLHRLAILKAKEQKLSESEQYFRDALNLDKENTALLCDFAKLYSDQKNYADAETILKNALLIAPDHRRTLYNLGLIIALQNDRQSEGLRYLKLAIGETAAYRELAKIYRQQDNNAQAEFAEQRASILEKTQTPHTTDTKTSPTVPMDDQTKKGLIQRVKEELLRLETAEIAEIQTITIKKITPQSKSLTTETLQKEALQTEPTLTKLLPTKSSSEESLLAKLLPSKSPSTEPLQTEVLPIKPLQMKTTHDPFLVAAESQNVGELQKDQQLTESAIESFSVETNSNIKTESPETVKSLQTFPETPRQQVVKILKPEPQTNEPVKTFQQEIPSDRQTNNLRTLPATDFRISNSTENDTNISQQPEVRPLTIIPLEDAATVKNIPEYTAINVRKIPLTDSETTTQSQRSEEKNSVTTTADTMKTEKSEGKISVSRFQHPVSSDSAATISISLSKNKTAQNNVSDKTNSDFSARLYLEQPVNLITFNSQRSQFHQPQAPIPTFNSAEKSLQENQEKPEKQDDQSPRNVSIPYRRLDLENRRLDSENIATQNEHFVTNSRSNISQRSTKSILRPGAGKVGIQEGLDSYVYVDPNALKNNDTPKDNVTSHADNATSHASESAEKNTVTKSAQETTLITKSITDSFSLMRPIPGKLANQLADSSRSLQIIPAPSTETGIKSITETAEKTVTPIEIAVAPSQITETKTTKTIPSPVAKNPQPEIPTHENLSVQNKPDTESIAQTDSEIDKKIDLQFSSTQAPTVLKFEIASTTKSENLDKPEILNNSEQLNKIVTQKQIAALAKPVTVPPETVKADSLQKNAADTFQPPTVLKFGPAQNKIVTKPNLVSVPPETAQSKLIQPEPVQSEIVQSKPIQPEPVQSEIVQPKPIQPEPESVFVQKTEPLLPTQPKPVIDTKIEVLPQPTITETIVSAIPTVSTIPEIPTTSEKPIPQTDSVAISNPKSDPFLPTPAAAASVTTVQELALPTQQPETKTEIVGNTLPQPNSAHIEAFLPILTTPPPETFFVPKSTAIPALESPQTEANLRFKIANENKTKITAIPFAKSMTEQNVNQQLKITTNSDTLKFVTPNRPQQNSLSNQKNTDPKPKDETASKPTIKIVPKQTEEIVFKPVEMTPKPTTIEIVPKSTDEIISKPTTTEIVPKSTDKIVSKPTTIEIVPKSTDETVSKPTIEIVPKSTDEIVFKPVEVIPQPMNEIVSKSTAEIISKQKKSYSKPEPLLTLIPLTVEDSTPKTTLERPPVQTQTRTPITPSETEDVFVLKRTGKTKQKLKTELEIEERLALNSISKGMFSDKPDKDEKLPKETEIKKTEIIEEEPIGFATTRKAPSIVVQRERSGKVDEFLKPRENFGKHPIFSMDSSLKNETQEKDVSQNQEQEENAGFARSIKYSKKTQPNSYQNTTK